VEAELNDPDGKLLRVQCDSCPLDLRLEPVSRNFVQAWSDEFDTGFQDILGNVTIELSVVFD
jgi:hypothetical protein